MGERVLIKTVETSHSVIRIYTQKIDRTPEERASATDDLYRLLAESMVRDTTKGQVISNWKKHTG